MSTHTEQRESDTFPAYCPSCAAKAGGRCGDDVRRGWTTASGCSRTDVEATCGPYELVRSTVSDGFVIRRKDDDHPRTVAFVDTTDQWQTFVSKLHEGYSEVGAVVAIDAT